MARKMNIPAKRLVSVVTRKALTMDLGLTGWGDERDEGRTMSTACQTALFVPSTLLGRSGITSHPSAQISKGGQDGGVGAEPIGVLVEFEVEDIVENVTNPSLAHSVGGLDTPQPTDVPVKAVRLEHGGRDGSGEAAGSLRRGFSSSSESLDEEGRGGEPSKSGTWSRRLGKGLRERQRGGLVGVHNGLTSIRMTRP